jgi:hypothetical protein
MDLLDLQTGKYFKTFTGSYYERYPETQNDAGVPFDYEFVDTTEWHYQKLLTNLVVNGVATATIKTNNPQRYRDNAFVVLQDGRMYVIIQVIQDTHSANKEAYRVLTDVAGIDYVLRLSEVDNPRGLR